MLENIKNIFNIDKIGEPPWEYDFLYNLNPNEYPKYLAKIFNYRTGEKLPLKYDFKNQAWVIDKKKCKTFNQKIQWLKLYGVTDLMRTCTDKVAVRDYVKEKIGEEYLKPILQICDSFEEIDFESLPNAFVIKCNHGCKWQYIIKNKEDYLQVEKLVGLTQKQITNWLQQDYSLWSGFELQYRNINPKILIEPLMRDEINTDPVEINVYCFKGKPKVIYKFHKNNSQTIYDEKLQFIKDLFVSTELTENLKPDDIINQSYDLSKLLSEKFNFVRVDWMIYQNKLYFEELTFTPYSGFHLFKNKIDSIKIAKYIERG